MAQTGPQPRLPTERVEIVTKSGSVLAFMAEIAATPRSRQVGLMFRPTLADHEAMLFDFGRTEPVAMWMRHTFIGLDMLFIRDDGIIANIGHNAMPRSEQLIRSKGQVRYVLEINAGLARKFGIRPGDRVTLPD